MDLSSAPVALHTLSTRERLPTVVPKEVPAMAATLLADVQALESNSDASAAVDVTRLREQVAAFLNMDAWPAQASGLMTCTHLIELHMRDGAHKTVTSALLSDAFCEQLIDSALRHLENREPRVRTSVVSLLRALCQLRGVSVWERLYPAIRASIETNFDRDGTEVYEQMKSGPTVTEASKAPEDGDEATAATAVATKAPVPVIAHDTVGWKALESSTQALAALVEGCGAAVCTSTYLTRDLLDSVVPRAVAHVNRFVRQAIFEFCTAVVNACGGEGLRRLEFATKLSKLIYTGLADNWSQVRYAASVCCRAFMLATESYRAEFYALLVPCMVLNRYYVAEGVKLYSQETWRLVMGSEGTAVVASVVGSVVPFFLAQCDADNHAVREAACHCIAELANKVDRASVSPHVPTLLAALIVCFKDESWPVRDAACLATGNFVASFPEASRPKLEELYGLWFDHLWDNIWSVREDSAVALGKVMSAYKDEAVAKVVAKLKEDLPKAKDQPKDSTKFSDLSNDTQFGVARHTHANDVDAHTGNQVFSCGSLAPKLRKGGCMDHGFSRAKQPWEATDGCVYLLRELALQKPEEAAQFMPTLAEVARVKHFLHFTSLQETVWKQLPAIAKALGKRVFKRHLQEFIEPMFATATGSHQLSACAAADCIGFVNAFVGPSIFRGRLEPDQVDLLRHPRIAGAVSAAAMRSGRRPTPGGVGAFDHLAAGGMPMTGRAPWATTSEVPARPRGAGAGVGAGAGAAPSVGLAAKAPAVLPPPIPDTHAPAAEKAPVVA